MADHPRDAGLWPVLRAVAEFARHTPGRPVGLDDLRRATGLPPQRIQRLAGELRVRGLLDRDVPSHEEFALTRAGLHTLRDQPDPPSFAEA